MGHEAANIIRDEHRSFAAVLQAIQYLVKDIRDNGSSPDFQLLHAMLHYIREYPERLHHPKEDRYLFAALKQRSREADAVIADLEQEHDRGEQLLNELTVALSAFEAGAPHGLERLAWTIDAFADFYWTHMQKEEDQVLSFAECLLTEQDWDEVHAAFISNRDPDRSRYSEEEFRRLFTRIADLAPAPIGSGGQKD